MIQPRKPRYDWGMRVLAAADLINDGSFPEQPVDALLVAAGTEGEIVNIGMQSEANLPIYLVEFGPDRVVGCFEEEIVPCR
ncbi:nitrogen fixation protein NifZ [Sphingomonas azotifigens]|uniref:nitrogen fixation protein NifZ n=1 Tax=Sphingomonas azotifigens TaxID=330920 RepID=UPI0009FFA3E2|nr:nitrogen fixation protein NifZ [Sphingomonas azotifigens]